LDTSAEQVALARELGLATVDQQEISAYLASLEDASVDVVLLMDVLEHFRR
jgi:2-polyprenyl-3-methyl-5-hydroxy-6-metoxy-1,4-benzoquinol methylase